MSGLHIATPICHRASITFPPGWEGRDPEQSVDQSQLLEDARSVGFLPEFLELLAFQAPDVNGSGLERLARTCFAGHKPGVVRTCVADPRDDVVAFGRQQRIDCAMQ